MPLGGQVGFAHLSEMAGRSKNCPLISPKRPEEGAQDRLDHLAQSVLHHPSTGVEDGVGVGAGVCPSSLSKPHRQGWGGWGLSVPQRMPVFDMEISAVRMHVPRSEVYTK